MIERAFRWRKSVVKQLKRDSTKHEGSNKLGNDGKADPCERNYHGRLVLDLNKNKPENSWLICISVPSDELLRLLSEGKRARRCARTDPCKKKQCCRRQHHLLSPIQLPGSNV